MLVVNALIVSYLLYVRFSRTGRVAEEAIHKTEADKKALKEELKAHKAHSEEA